MMALIDHVAGNKPLADNTRQDIVERSDGIPLFVEEMTKTVLEAEGEGETAGALASSRRLRWQSPRPCMPRLMARLDRLGTPSRGADRSGDRAGVLLRLAHSVAR